MNTLTKSESEIDSGIDIDIMNSASLKVLKEVVNDYIDNEDIQDKFSGTLESLYNMVSLFTVMTIKNVPIVIDNEDIGFLRAVLIMLESLTREHNENEKGIK